MEIVATFNLCICSLCLCSYSIIFLLSFIAETIIDKAVKLLDRGVLIKVTVRDEEQLVITAFKCSYNNISTFV